MYAIRMVAVLIVIAAVLTGCVPDGDRATVLLGGIEVRAIVADEPAEWTRGLQGYGELAPGEGMLFDFGSPLSQTFTMKDVTFPIDVVFVDAASRVSAIEPLDPGDARLVPSPSPAPYVIELPQGWAAENGIAVGDAFEVQGEER